MDFKILCSKTHVLFLVSHRLGKALHTCTGACFCSSLADSSPAGQCAGFSCVLASTAMHTQPWNSSWLPGQWHSQPYWTHVCSSAHQLPAQQGLLAPSTSHTLFCVFTPLLIYWQFFWCYLCLFYQTESKNTASGEVNTSLQSMYGIFNAQNCWLLGN